MKDYRNNRYPEHDRTSCNDETLANAVPDGSGCRRCNALLFNRYEELLEEVQALHALRKDAERYRWLRDMIKNRDLTIAKVGSWSLESWSGDDPDHYIDAAMEKQE